MEHGLVVEQWFDFPAISQNHDRSVSLPMRSSMA
jgi:hypothetical protein